MAVRAVDFVKASWVNSNSQLSLKKLRGKVIVLDFFTYCCVNCINNVQTINRLHQMFSDQIEVIGVHSAKFDQEKKDEALALAMARLGITYEVINDASLEFFKQYAIKAWPTTILIDQNSYIAYTFQGELEFNVLSEAIETLLPLQALPKHTPVYDVNTLRFPQKVTCDTHTLFIANTGANAVLVVDYKGKILEKISNIMTPMGMCAYENKLYITTGSNGQVIVYDTTTKTTQVLLENLRTPYDILVFESHLVVALAGSHEIVAYSFDGDETWRIGNRFEALRDGRATEAQLAQPSGLTFLEDTLYFVDAETSALRFAHRMQVKTLIGEGLFSFGDANEGEILLQHPQDIVAGQIGDGCGGGRLFIADTFNSKLKVFDPETRIMMTLCDTLNEPGGIDKKGCDIFIADTNNSKIVRYNLSQMKAYDFPLFE